MDEGAVSVRASDADRERVVRSLRGHLLAGRLVAPEFEERIERAYGAVTLDDLRELLRDLPRSGTIAERGSKRRPLLPGNRPFAARFYSEDPPPVVISEAMRTFAPNFMAVRYRVESSHPTRLVFRRDQFPFWAVAAAILIPFLGLLALVAAGRESSEIVVSATELDRDRTVVDVFGVASVRVRRAMLELER